MLPELHLVAFGLRLSLALHPALLALGVGAGSALAVRRAPGPRAPVLLACALLAVAGLGGARGLAHLLHAGGGGLASAGGIVAALVVLPLAARLAGLRPAVLADAVVPGALLGFAVGRVGCFLAGCCLGMPSSLPWSVVFPEIGPPARHPLQLYEAAAYAGIAALLPPRGAVPGRIAARGCLAWALARLALECLRDPAAADPLVGPLTLAQGVALVVAGGAVRADRRLRRPGGIDYASPPEDSCAWPTRSR